MSSQNTASIIGQSADALSLPTSGNVLVLISGKDFSSVYGTIARISATSCSDSIWRSTSSMRCRIPPGVGNQLPFAVSSLKKISRSMSENVDHLFPYLLTTISSNVPSSGSFEIVPVSSALGSADYSSQARLMFSALSSHRWLSDTYMALKISSFMRSSLANVVISLGINMAIFQNSTSFTAPSLLLRLTAYGASASSGSVFSILSGERLGTFGVSSTVRIAATSCLVNGWISDSVMKCKIPYGLGIVNSMILSGSAYDSFPFRGLTAIPSLYREPLLESFLVSGNSIFFQGNDFGPVSPSGASVAQSANITVPPYTERILVSSSALMDQRAILLITATVTISAISRLDDIVILLESFQSKTLNASTQLVLFQSQCFGCLVDPGSTITFEFTDNAAATVPLSRCGTRGSYRAKYTNLASIYGFSGILNLKVISGSNTITFQSVSIFVARSSINMFFFRTLDNNETEETTSKAITWTSDSAFSSALPAIVGQNVSIRGLLYQKSSNFLYGLKYPAVEFANFTETLPCSGSRSVSLMGFFFGQFDSSPRLRIGVSSCAATAWISDITVICRRIAVGQANEQLSLHASVSKIVGGTPTLSQYVVSPAAASIATLPSTQSTTLSMILLGIGVSGPSMKLRAGSSSAMTTNWLSDSVVVSLIPFRCHQAMLVSASVNNYILTAQYGLAKAPLLVQNLLNPEFSRTGSNLIAILGIGFGIFGHSATAQTQDSNCPSSNWISDSSVICRIPQATLKGGRAFSISVDHSYMQSATLNDIYGNPLTNTRTQIELYQFQPANLSLSLLEQLKISSFGSNYGFVTSITVGSTKCREVLWSSQSSIGCSINCLIPYKEPFLIFRLEDSNAVTSATTVNTRYLPVTYTVASALMISISLPPAITFGDPLWAVTSFSPWQRFDFSFQFFNNNSEPYMRFFTDQNGIDQFSRVPIFVTINVSIENSVPQIGSILCEDVPLANTLIPSGEKSAAFIFSQGFCQLSDRARFMFSICLTSDEQQKSLFSSTGTITSKVISNTTQVVLKSPWFSVRGTIPFFAANSITNVHPLVTAGMVQSMTPSFEFRTKTFCSDTYAALDISLICSQGSAKFVFENSAENFAHTRLLKYSCFFVMPDWYAIKSDVACQFRVSIVNTDVFAMSSSFVVVSSYFYSLKSEQPLKFNQYKPSDIISNDMGCYKAFIYDRFGNLIIDESKIVQMSAVYTVGELNISYPLNGTLRMRSKLSGAIEWCNIQATLMASRIHLTCYVIPASSFDNNSTFVLQSFSVTTPGLAQVSSITMSNSSIIINNTAIATDFKLPQFVVILEDAFKNKLTYMPGFLLRVTMNKPLKSRTLLSTFRAVSIIDPAIEANCSDFRKFTLFDVYKPGVGENNISAFFVNNVKVCEKGQHVVKIDLGTWVGSPETGFFSPMVADIGGLTYIMSEGTPSMVQLVLTANDDYTEVKTYSTIHDLIFVQILDQGFNVVYGTAIMSLMTVGGLFAVMPPSLQITGDQFMIASIWLSGNNDLNVSGSRESLKISSCSLTIVPSSASILVTPTCLPGTYLDHFDNLPSSIQCTPCASGHVSSLYDAKKCNICSPGTFAAQDSRSCIKCPPGSATNAYGSISCRKCSQFYFSNSRGTECLSLIFVQKPSFNVIPFTSTLIPPIELYDEISQQSRNPAKVHINLICLKRFNCSSPMIDDGKILFSKSIQIASDQAASHPDEFSLSTICGNRVQGSNFRWSMTMDASDIYPLIETYDEVSILINKCQPSIDTIHPQEPKPKSTFNITFSETVTMIGIDFSMQQSVIMLIPGYPDLLPDRCLFSCLTATNQIIKTTSVMVQNPNLIDTYECNTNFSFGMKMGDTISLDVILMDGRYSRSNVELLTLCPAVYYLSQNNTAHGCEKCPYPQSLTFEANKPSIEDCVCNKGYYGTYGNDCLTCPEAHPGFNCVYFNSRWPQINPGYYIDYSRMHNCKSIDDCNAITECLYPWACPGDNELSCLGSLGEDTCYAGRGCYKCCYRYYMDDSNMCQPCAPRETSILILVLALLAPFILVGVATAAATPARKIAVNGFLTLFGFFQSVTNVNVIQIPWPRFLDGIFNFLKFFSFGLSAIKEECSIPIDPITKLFLMAALPFALAIFLVAFSALQVHRTLHGIRAKINTLPRKHTLVSIERYNNLKDITRCFLMDVFSLHPGFVPNSFFAALSVTIKDRTENTIKMSAVLNVNSKQFLKNFKNASKFGHRGMLFKSRDFEQVGQMLKDAGTQQMFMECSLLTRQRISSIFAVFVITLQGTLSALLGTFRCTALDGKMVLVSNPEIVCDSSIDVTYSGMFVVSLLGCFWCGLVTPIIMSVILASKWCRLFALRQNECYLEMFDSLVADTRSTNYLFLPGFMIRTSLTLLVVVVVKEPAQQVIMQIVFNFVEVTYLLVIRPFLIKISNDIEQTNCMVNFTVLLSGLLFIAQADGQPALQGQAREVLGMFVAAVLMIATFIIVTSVVIDVGSNLILEGKDVVNYWWKAFVLFLGESILKEFSGLFFGLQMVQYSSLTSHRLRETMRSQKQALVEKLLNVEDKLNEKYMDEGGSYFRSSYLMSVIHKREVNRVRQIQEVEDRNFQAPLADLKRIMTLPEIHAVSSIHQIIFNRHPDRVNDRDPTYEYKLFAHNAMGSLDKSISKTMQPLLLAFLLYTEEGNTGVNLESVEFSKLMTAKWKAMQKLIARSSRTLIVLTDINEAPVKKWPSIFRPLQEFVFTWNMGYDTFGQFMAAMNEQDGKPQFDTLSLMLAAKGRHKRRKNLIGGENSATEDQRLAREWIEEEKERSFLMKSGTRKSTFEPGMMDEEDWWENTDASAGKIALAPIEKPKWGMLREQLLKDTSTSVALTSKELHPKEALVRNTIAAARKEKPVEKFEKDGLKIDPDSRKFTNIPVSNNWIIEYSAVKSQWQLKHLADRGKDSCVAFLAATTVLSGCCNTHEWQLWDGNPRHLPLRKYNVQSSVLVDVVTPGKPDAKSVRMTGFFSRKRATIPNEAIFWQFAPSLNGEYSHLGLISSNRNIYFNTFAAEVYLAAEALKEAEIQAARFGHSHEASKASVIVARRVSTNKRFVSQPVPQHQPPVSLLKPTAAAKVSLLPVAELSDEERAKVKASGNRSKFKVDAGALDGDDWSKSSNAS